MSSGLHETAIDEIVARCNGDIRGALKALLLVNEQLEAELAQLHAVVAHGRVEGTEIQRSALAAVFVARAARFLDIASLDFFGQGLDQFRHLFEVRIDR